MGERNGITCLAMSCHALPCHAVPCFTVHASRCDAMPCHAYHCLALPCHALIAWPILALPCELACSFVAYDLRIVKQTCASFQAESLAGRSLAECDILNATASRQIAWTMCIVVRSVVQMCCICFAHRAEIAKIACGASRHPRQIVWNSIRLLHVASQFSSGTGTLQFSIPATPQVVRTSSP